MSNEWRGMFDLSLYNFLHVEISRPDGGLINAAATLPLLINLTWKNTS